jgi:ribosomal protein S27E
MRNRTGVNLMRKKIQMMKGNGRCGFPTEFGYSRFVKELRCDECGKTDNYFDMQASEVCCTNCGLVFGPLFYRDQLQEYMRNKHRGYEKVEN